MGKKSREKTTRRDIKQKGEIVERIAAMMHKTPGVQVRTNVRLPTVGGKRKREIDVLLIGEIAGYPIQIPIECKNEASPLGSPSIDQFVGKLGDVGLPTQNAIMISASGFTTGAEARAQKAGIKTLLLTGLDKDRLESAFAEALQSVVYLLGVIEGIQLSNDVPAMAPLEFGLLWSDDGRQCKVLPTMIWEKWRAGIPQSRIGSHEVSIEVPPGWYQRIGDRKVVPRSLSATVSVSGLVVSVPGRVRRHSLVDSENRRVEKFQATAEFDLTKSSYPVNHFSSEDQLRAFLLGRPQALKLTLGRLRLPRLRVGPLYWPPSRRALNRLYQHAGPSLARGEQPPPIQLDSVEGTGLETIFEPSVFFEQDVPIGRPRCQGTP